MLALFRDLRTASALVRSRSEHIDVWKCENPECPGVFTEYVNGCPRCSARGLSFSVRVVTAWRTGINPLVFDKKPRSANEPSRSVDKTEESANTKESEQSR